MTHPPAGALLELYFEESGGAERETLAAHVRECRRCEAELQDVRALDGALVIGPFDGPPADGLERVLARVAEVAPARARRAQWARVVGPSALALLAGGWAIRLLAERLRGLGPLPGLSLGPFAGDVLSLSLAVLVVAAAGALVTLAVAPVLILESHGRS
jgi:hypothetical protein